MQKPAKILNDQEERLVAEKQLWASSGCSQPLDDQLQTSDRNAARKIPELLAPAGGFEQLRYALYFGADAVYLACDKFGLRQRAQNFSLEDMPRAVAMAHDAGAKVYVTLNAYLHDDDFADLPAYLRALEEASVDAVIVSDLGVLAAVRQYAPSVDIHVSTQASVSNAAAARMWHELGAKRIVTAREMSLEEIAALKRELPEVELEVFVQGAMCMAISGRCLISDFLTGRSANQGHCVQPCRWSYRLEEDKGQGLFPQVDEQQESCSPQQPTNTAQPANLYPIQQPANFVLEEPTRPGEYFPVEEDEHGTYLMNSKDLNMLAHVDDLIAAGVDSIKIEGRVKKAFYVATVVNAYRHVLDGEDPQQWEGELDRISHRPYSTGFFYGDAEQSFEDDIYVQRYDWVAEVIESRPIVQPAVQPQFDAQASAASETAAMGLLGSAASEADKQQWRTIVYCRNRFYEGDVLELLSPHHEIIQIPVAGLEEVFLEKNLDSDLGIASESASGSGSISVSDSVLDSESAKFGSEFASGPDPKFGAQVGSALDLRVANTVPVDVANKAMGVYSLITSVPLCRYDILRVERRDPSRKN